MIILRHRHVQPRVHVQTNLDPRATGFYFSYGGLEGSRPFVMNDCILHKRVSLNSSPAPFMPSKRCSEPRDSWICVLRVFAINALRASRVAQVSRSLI